MTCANPTRSNSGVRRLEDAAMGILLPALRALAALRPRRSPPAGPRRMLIVKWCCLGDAVVSLYAIREFKRRHPEARLEMLVSSRIAEVYRAAPWVEAVHVLPVTGHRLARELLNPRLWFRLLSFVVLLRRRRFDVMVDLELYRANGALLKRLFGIPFSRGFRLEGALDKGHDVQFDRRLPKPEWQCFYQVLGLEPPPPEEPPGPLFPRHRVRPRPGEETHGSRRVGVVFGSSINWPQKKWPWEYYARTLRLLRDEGIEFVLFGSSPEREEAGKIAAEAGGGVLDTTGTLDYAGLREAVSACDLVFGNDTGTMHLAAACGVPTVTLFGPTDPRIWNPLTSTPVYLEDVPCRPCYYLGSMPPCPHFDCLRKLQPDLVAGKIRSLLAQGRADRKPA